MKGTSSPSTECSVNGGSGYSPKRLDGPIPGWPLLWARIPTSNGLEAVVVPACDSLPRPAQLSLESSVCLSPSSSQEQTLRLSPCSPHWLLPDFRSL